MRFNLELSREYLSSESAAMLFDASLTIKKIVVYYFFIVNVYKYNLDKKYTKERNYKNKWCYNAGIVKSNFIVLHDFI